MPRISYKSIAIAFTAELGADLIIQNIVFFLFAQDLVSADMTDEQLQQVQKVVLATTAYRPCTFMLGMATTVLGGYFAARLARRIPYYHGLAMGVVGVIFSLMLWSSDAPWYDYLGLLLTIPAAIYGAHIARRHIPDADAQGQT